MNLWRRVIFKDFLIALIGWEVLYVTLLYISVTFIPSIFGGLAILLKVKTLSASWILTIISTYGKLYIYDYAKDETTWLGRQISKK